MSESDVFTKLHKHLIEERVIYCTHKISEKNQAIIARALSVSEAPPSKNDCFWLCDYRSDQYESKEFRIYGLHAFEFYCILRDFDFSEFVLAPYASLLEDEEAV